MHGKSAAVPVVTVGPAQRRRPGRNRKGQAEAALEPPDEEDPDEEDPDEVEPVEPDEEEVEGAGLDEELDVPDADAAPVVLDDFAPRLSFR